MSDDRIRTLVACGAAGGIAATFNAPVAGVIFAMEVILGEFAIANFSTVVIASVTASVVARIFMGDVPAFAVPEYTLRDPWELLLYILLGVLAAFVGVGFVRLLYLLEDVFDGWNFPEYLKPVAGGLGVGAVGLVAPEVFGVGYDAIERVLHNQFVLSGVLILLVAKIIATSLTLGSGDREGFSLRLFSWVPCWEEPLEIWHIVGSRISQPKPEPMPWWEWPRYLPPPLARHCLRSLSSLR